MTAKQERRLTVGVTDLDDLAVGWVLSGATGAADENVRAHQLVGIAGDAHASVYQDHDVLADALDVGEDVRREDHARAVFGHDAHELLEQLEASDRIEVRDWLVEKQHLGPLAERERKRHLGALSGRKRPDRTVERQAEVLDTCERVGVVPSRIEPASDLERLSDREARMKRAVLGDEADARQKCNAFAPGIESEDADPPRGRTVQPDGDLEERRLSRAVWTDKTGDLPAGQQEIASTKRVGPSVSLRQSRCLEHGVHARAASFSENASFRARVMSATTLSRSRPAACAPASQRSSDRRSG